MTDLFNRNITYLRLSVTDKCNLRCKYCMPAEGVPLKQHSQLLTLEEMVCAVKVCAELGVKKVRITGGEPLVKKNIVQLCGAISKIDQIEELCLTTNGILLPSMCSDLKKAGVKRLNISLDTLNEEKYKNITRCGNLENVWKGIDVALNSEFEKIKINCVLIGGFNDDEIRDIAFLSVRYPIDIRFIELMPMLSYFEDKNYIPNKLVLEKLPELVDLGNFDGVSKEYMLPDAKGKIGLISPISDKFCASCNRIRITSDGKVKPCLHSADEFSIRGLSESEMKNEISKAILRKIEHHDILSANNLSLSGRSMNQIGG